MASTLSGVTAYLHISTVCTISLHQKPLYMALCLTIKKSLLHPRYLPRTRKPLVIQNSFDLAGSMKSRWCFATYQTEISRQITSGDDHCSPYIAYPLKSCSLTLSPSMCRKSSRPGLRLVLLNNSSSLHCRESGDTG